MHDGRAGIDVEAAEVPQFPAGSGVATDYAVITGPEKDLAVGNAGARFDVTVGLILPPLPAGVRLQAVKLAVRILMEALADIEQAVGQARRRDRNRLHVLIIVKAPE